MLIRAVGPGQRTLVPEVGHKCQAVIRRPSDTRHAVPEADDVLEDAGIKIDSVASTLLGGSGRGDDRGADRRGAGLGPPGRAGLAPGDNESAGRPKEGSHLQERSVPARSSWKPPWRPGEATGPADRLRSALWSTAVQLFAQPLPGDVELDMSDWLVWLGGRGSSFTQARSGTAVGTSILDTTFWLALARIDLPFSCPSHRLLILASSALSVPGSILNLLSEPLRALHYQ
jgi:hypothetical protein